MAIPEACGLWIEQRVQQELEAKGDTGTSLREIGRVVAAEVEKYFETKINPDAIRMKASRMQSGTNVPPQKPPEISTPSDNLKNLNLGKTETANLASFETGTVLSDGQSCGTETKQPKEPPKPPKKHASHGGPRPGAGRKPVKPMLPPVQNKVDEVMSDEYRKAHDFFFQSICEEKRKRFNETTKETILEHLRIIYNIVTIK